ncbi:MAG: MerR family transcriptional regulator [Bacteroidales bacterium]|nr:MerR family transcriptional regulator [Candidatus Cryptobacteroides aphodequi]
MQKMFYSISEAAELIGEPISKIRYWSDKFPSRVQPHRTAKGNRQFTQDDIDALKQIKLLAGRGLSLEAVERELASGSNSAESVAKALDQLKSIRERLLEIREKL